MEEHWRLLFQMRIEMGVVAILGLAFAVAGCSTSTTKARIDVSQTRFETPETLGKSKHWVGLRAAVNNSTIVGFPVGATTANEMDDHRLDEQDDAGFNPSDMVFADIGVKYGFADNFDFGIEGESRGTVWAKAKLQLLGKPESRSAAGDTSLAIAARIGTISVSDKKSDPCFACVSYDSDKVDVGNTLFDVALLGGYRTSASLLGYLGAAYQQVNHDAKSVHAVYDNNDALLSRDKLSWQGKTSTVGVFAGIMLRPDLAKNTRVFFEVNRAVTTTEEKTLNATYGGMQISAGW